MQGVFFLALMLQDGASTSGRILVVKDDDVQILDVDGTIRNVTNNGKSMREEAPAWSRDGKRIVYGAGKGMASDLFISEADGSSLRRLAKAKGSEKYSGPAFSPDGKRIVANYGFVDLDLALLDVESGGMVKLTEDKERQYGAAWSPDSKKIAYLCQDYIPQGSGGTWGLAKVWVMNADGSGKRKLTTHDREDKLAAWSPDGTKIAFYSTAVDKRDGNVTMMGGDDLFVMNSDGSGLCQITSAKKSSNEFRWIDWSPDGRQLVAAGRIEGAPNTIHIVDADGSNLKELVPSKWGQEFNRVQFSPDGRRLLILDGYDGVCVVNADGSDLKKIGKGYWPQWAPQ